MAFEEVEFPDNISPGSSGGPGFNTTIISTDSGQEERVSRWATPRRRYDAAYNIRSRDDFDVLRDFAIAMNGAAIGFRFKDHADFTTSPNGRDAPAIDDVQIGTGDGSQTVFQLKKFYVQGTITRTRLLRKIVDGTILVEVDGVAKTVGVDFSINLNTGEITFGVAPAGGLAVKAGCEFRVPVRFGENIDESLDVTIDAFDAATLGSITLVEIMDGLENNEVAHAGGAKAFTFSVDTLIVPSDGRVIRAQPLAASKTIRVLAPNKLPAGGPYHLIENPAVSSFSMNVEDEDEVGIVSLAADESAALYIGIDDAGNPEWKAV